MCAETCFVVWQMVRTRATADLGDDTAPAPAARGRGARRGPARARGRARGAAPARGADRALSPEPAEQRQEAPVPPRDEGAAVTQDIFL